MAIADDLSIAVNGDIRYTGSGANYTVLQVHRFLQDYADNAAASGDDLLAIFSETPSERSTDNIITLINGYNVDDTVMEHVYDGSITQDDGATVYSGVVVYGAVETGTEIQIVQNGHLLRNYWGTGINADATQNILLRLCVKTRANGVDIDGKRLRVQAREYGDLHFEFSFIGGLGNASPAVFTQADLNNETVEATIRGYGGGTANDINNAEGLASIDVDNNGTPEQYYSEWNRGTHTINDLYEYCKMVASRPSAADSDAATGTDYSIDNGTITSQAVGFTARTQTGGEKLVSAIVSLKIGLGTPTDYLRLTVWDDSAGPNAIVATSELVLANVLTSSYQDLEFVFHDNVTLTSAGTYYLAVENVDASGAAVGDASNYVQSDGDATGTNRYEYNAGWGVAQTGDLQFAVYTSPVQHAMPGNLFRGITHSFGWDTEVGTPTMATNENWAWGTLIQVSSVTGTFLPGEAVHEDTATPAWKGRVIAYDSADTSLLIVHESGTITGTDTFTGQTSGATATADSSVAPQTANSGGEMKLLAFQDDGADGEAYVQLLRGAAPVDEEILYCTFDSADSLPALDQSVTVESTKLAITPRTLAANFLGQSTGSAIIGAYGIGIEFADLSASDKLFDLTNAPKSPPTQATFTVSGMTATGGRLLVAPRSGSAINTTQMTLATTLNGPTETQVDVGVGNIPADTPATGILRIVLDDGRHRRQPYTAHDSDRYFTIASADYQDPDDATAGNGVYIAYIDDDYATDQAQFTVVFDATRDLFVRFRDGRPASAIKTFENAVAQLAITGGSAAVVRTPDV